MKNNIFGTSTRRGFWVFGLLSLVMMFFATNPVFAQDLEELLQQVGETYATSYSSPFLYAFGPNQNSAMYTTAHIPWGGLTFGFGVKVMATHMNEDDQFFSKNIENVTIADYDPGYNPSNPAYDADTVGHIVMRGPTIFGDPDTEGSISGYANGIEIFRESTIAGLVKSNFIPLAAPEAYIGGVFGLKLTVRYFPEIDMSEYGKTKYFGYGLQWSPNGLLPDFPVDVMVGFFDQELSVGTLLQTNASTMFIGASKEFGILRAYGGFAKDSSDMSISYEYIDEGIDVSFDIEGSQESHITLGVSVFGLSVEMNKGDLTTYSSGLMIGF